MFHYHVVVTCIGLFLPLSLSLELRHQSSYTSTENEFEFEFTKEARVQESDGKLMTKTLFVGGFHLAVEDEFTRDACARIEDQFLLRTDCSCSPSILHSATIEFGCRNKHFMCNQQDYCAQPVYTGTVGYETRRFSTDFCLNNLQKDGKQFGNFCVAIDMSTTDSKMKIKRCLAQVGKSKCDCAICGEESGVRVDCTGIDSPLISRSCDAVNLVTNDELQNRKVSGFFPSFMP